MIFDYFYANIYNWYNKMRLNGRKVDPQIMTSVLFGICTCGWFVLLIDLYARLFHKNYINSNTLVYGFFGILGTGAVNFYYSRDDRYQKVFDTYIVSGKVKNKNNAIVFSFLFIFLPLILLVFLHIL